MQLGKAVLSEELKKVERMTGLRFASILRSKNCAHFSHLRLMLTDGGMKKCVRLATVKNVTRVDKGNE